MTFGRKLNNIILKVPCNPKLLCVCALFSEKNLNPVNFFIFKNVYKYRLAYPLNCPKCNHQAILGPLIKRKDNK